MKGPFTSRGDCETAFPWVTRAASRPQSNRSAGSACYEGSARAGETCLQIERRFAPTRLFETAGPHFTGWRGVKLGLPSRDWHIDPGRLGHGSGQLPRTSLQVPLGKLDSAATSQAPVARHAATLDTGPWVRRYPGGIRTRLS